MRRCAYLTTFLILTLLFCTVAGAIRQDFAFSAKPGEQGASPPGESSREHLRGKDALLNFVVRQADAGKPGGESRPAEKKEAAGPTPQEKAAAPESFAPKEKGAALSAEEAVHFLLIGRRQSRAAEVLMVVTLVPESCALLTAIDPAIEVAFGEKRCSIGELPAKSACRDSLYRAVAGLSGFKPQFYIEIDLDGLHQMTELLDREKESAAPAVAAKGEHPGEGGRKLLSLICDFHAATAEKEELLIDYLLTACEISSTSQGLKLLWLGYRHLTTDLSLSDLLSLRAVSQKISPFKVSFSTITHTSSPQRAQASTAPPDPAPLTDR